MVKKLYTVIKNRSGLIDVKVGVLNSGSRINITMPDKMKERVIASNSTVAKYDTLLREQINSMETLGIGGLDSQMQQLFEIVMFPRLMSPDKLEMLNFTPSKGFILYGPPGTGKTLIARKLAELLKAHFNFVRGPELMSGTVGECAKNVRKLFEKAEADWELYGAESPLHVIVVDEIDSLCPPRGSNNGLDAGATD